VKPPNLRAWLRSFEVTATEPDIVEIHVGIDEDFTPGRNTYRGALYGPGTRTVTDVSTEVDYYVRFVDLAGRVSDVAGPVRPMDGGGRL
jgi:hypothetical protein